MVKALIFDFDGVIVDTEPLHYEGFLRVMKRYGYTMTYEHYKKNYLAFQDRDCFIGIFKEMGRDFDERLIEELIEEKGRWFFPLLSELPIRIRGEEGSEAAILTFEGLIDFVTSASKVYRLAVASGAQRNEVEVILRRLGIFNCFYSITTSGDYKKGKPDPEPYITAFLKLKEIETQLKVEECVGIEDSFFGVKSVKSAGMKCLAITNSYSEDILREYGADMVVKRLSDSLIPLKI